MKSLYLIINLASVSIPFLVSFHPRLQFYKKWKSLAKALVITTCVFIIWDIIFTHNGIWGFNEDFFLGIKLALLPIEEWLFFICIPYACIFMHYALIELFPKLILSRQLVKFILIVGVLLGITLIMIFSQHWYTVINFSLFIVVFLIGYRFNKNLLQRFLLTFVFMLIPFFIVNGILTGTSLLEPIVWYDNAENMGLRLGTIPIEDTFYAFTLILANLLLIEYFEANKA